MLVAGVPFIKSSVSTSASNLFDQIIPAAPSKNSLETTVANTNDYSFNHLMAKINSLHIMIIYHGNLEQKMLILLFLTYHHHQQQLVHQHTIY